MTSIGPQLDAARGQVVQRGLVPDAIGELTPVVSELPLESLGPVKQQLKRFFSDAPWTADDDEALADVVGAGSGGDRRELAPGLTLRWGWDQGRFRLRVEGDARSASGRAGEDETTSVPDLGDTFDGAVVPEATPSPRTIRFATPPLHGGAARNYDSADAAAADARVDGLFGDFDEVTNVLVGPDFVAVTIVRPDRWEELLQPVLRAVTAAFAGDPSAGGAPSATASVPGRAIGADEGDTRAPRRLERAWADLGALRAERPGDLEQILAVCDDAEPARRQVAAALLVDAPPDVAAGAWARLLGDSSRAVRRSVVDAAAGAERQELRPLFERALDDGDAWIRWKALAGIAAIGLGPSGPAVSGVAEDPDFRVRLEAARLLA